MDKIDPKEIEKQLEGVPMPDLPPDMTEDKLREAAQRLKSSSSSYADIMNREKIDDFVSYADKISQQVQDIISGKISPEEFDRLEN